SMMLIALVIVSSSCWQTQGYAGPGAARPDSEAAAMRLRDRTRNGKAKTRAVDLGRHEGRSRDGVEAGWESRTIVLDLDVRVLLVGSCRDLDATRLTGFSYRLDAVDDQIVDRLLELHTVSRQVGQS